MDRMKKCCLFLFLCFSLVGRFLHGEEADYEFSGRHFIASYVGCDHQALANLEELKKAFLLAVDESGATLLEAADYVFPPEGMTMVALLSESHASIHTYPEHDACFVDLFTCGTKCQAEKFDACLRDYLHPKKVSHKILVRDELVADE
jgi:S-adenosylmethionine decarboxylase